jgi:DNA-binding transcriptional ArsR family regulator
MDGEEHIVGEFVLRLATSQPSVSKHLAVLRKVGLLSVRRLGPNRIYRLNAKRLKPVLDWAKGFERSLVRRDQCNHRSHTFRELISGHAEESTTHRSSKSEP